MEGVKGHAYLYKKDKVTDPQNYRPVSVLPTLDTTFERVHMPQLSAFVLPHIPEEQLGFIPPGIGTLDVGAVLTDQIAQPLQAKKDVRLVALDFKGAFSTRCGGAGFSHIFGL